MAWTHLLGLDFGIRDRCAATVVGWRDGDPTLYVIESYKFISYPSKMIEEIRALEVSYPGGFIEKVGDVGGLGKAFSEELLQRHSVYIKPAEKQGKAAAIALFNGDLQRQRVKIVSPRCKDLLQEMKDLPWSATKDREAEGYPCDAADSCLYAFRAARSYLEVVPPPPPTRAEQVRAESEAEWARVAAENNAARDTDWFNE
jgi:hypothetical protein